MWAGRSQALPSPPSPPTRRPQTPRACTPVSASESRLAPPTHTPAPCSQLLPKGLSRHEGRPGGTTSRQSHPAQEESRRTQSGLFLAPQLFPPAPEPHRSPAASSVSWLCCAPHPRTPQAPQDCPSLPASLCSKAPARPLQRTSGYQSHQDGEQRVPSELTAADTGKGPLPKSAKLLTCRPHWSEQMAVLPAKCSPPGCGKEHGASSESTPAALQGGHTQTHEGG
uniref:Uncharacterized protein n=1 Tax=Rangifer tarandus platyrhynchus TaxID=3082113 RepID=A0ACB0F376_RANTA|nr:unnamed protein product [Rangifer tarandus platyrhynchus]